MAFTAMFDACVLFPAQLRDLLMELALTDLFRAKWTADIHREWIEAALVARPDLDRARLERTRDLMDCSVRDCVVEGYDSLVPSIELPDPNDRHVVAAAIVGRADIIVTFNLKDFPQRVIGRFGIDAQHPDEFLLHLLDLHSEKTCYAVERARARLKNPPFTMEQYLERLATITGLPRSSIVLRDLLL